MEKKKNISSGAKKTEKLVRVADKSAEEKELENLSSNEESKVSAKKSTRGKSTTKKTKGGAKKSADKIKSKKEKAQKKAEKKEAKKERLTKLREARLEKKLAHKRAKEERIAAAKQKKAELKEKRRERRDLLKSESKEDKRIRRAEERKEKLRIKAEKRRQAAEEKNKKREHALKVKQHKRETKNERRHAPGFGGWLAAVISLGVTSLALGTVVTFGWIGMAGMRADYASEYTRSVYELNSIVDELNENLMRAQATSSQYDMVRVFSDIAIESENAETVLERLPVDGQVTASLSSFINKMGDSAREMLYTAAAGEELTSSQQKTLSYMYETNAKVKSALNNLTSRASKKEMMAAISGKSCALGECFANLGEEIFATDTGADGFLSTTEEKVARTLEGEEEISAKEAEELAKKYFSAYKLSFVRCDGEAQSASLDVYNVSLNGAYGEMTAQISKLGGKLVAFDSFKACSDKNFDTDRCIAIAEQFLENAGYGDLRAVWQSENELTCNLTFTPIEGGAVLYCDKVLVKVCEERGVVTGMEAVSYVVNHCDRTLNASISAEEARSNINGEMEVLSERLALICIDGEERLCYEFFGNLSGGEYYSYVDAQSGEELSVKTVIGTAQGNMIR